MKPIEFDEDVESTAAGSRAEIAAALARTAKTQRPWLIVVSGGQSIGKMYRLERRLVLGRAPQCDILIDHDGVSRRHAMIELTVEGAIQIVDLDSRNGTFVNGDAISRETLRDGDRIQIGGTTILKFSYQDEMEEALQRNLYESATRDPLTRATNRRGFEEAFARECAYSRRHGTPLSILAFDVDHFKRVNDTHGHPAGDYVLRRLAELVAAGVRCEDVFARVGGEEFVLVLRGTPVTEALQCAERLRAAVQDADFTPQETRIPVTISIGVATLSPARHADPKRLLEDADRALYDAKHSGRNRVCRATDG
ncbi:MAG TPA: GGDEF domain-containing protein [Polyangiaceae bacterium]